MRCCYLLTSPQSAASYWCRAYSKGFTAKTDEVAFIAEHLSDPEVLAGQEVTVAGQNYICVAAEPGKEIYVQNGDTGVVFRKCGNNITGSFMAVAYHDHSSPPIATRMALVKVGEYFDARATA